MHHSILRNLSIFVLAASFITPIQAQAHRAWLLPSATVLSSDNAWVTVDAAISNDIFHTDHHAMDLGTIKVIAPNGEEVPMQHPHKGRYRSVFDVELNQAGTYKILTSGTGAIATWEENGERKRWRGALSELEEALPKQAKAIHIIETQRRLETFVTNGAPNAKALALSNQGLEMQFSSHPNDLFATETSQFQLIIDGKPAANTEVEIIPGGMRYRDTQEAIKVTSDNAGFIAITWPKAGMYWLSASYEDNNTTHPKAKRRASYVATFEVLPL